MRAKLKDKEEHDVRVKSCCFYPHEIFVDCPPRRREDDEEFEDNNRKTLSATSAKETSCTEAISRKPTRNARASISTPVSLSSSSSSWSSSPFLPLLLCLLLSRPTAKARSEQLDAVKPLPMKAQAAHILTNSRSFIVVGGVRVVLEEDWQKVVSKAFATRSSRRMSSILASSSASLFWYPINARAKLISLLLLFLYLFVYSAARTLHDETPKDEAAAALL